MKVFLYDGSFEGLLTAIFYAYKEKDKIRIERKEKCLINMIDEYIDILSEEDKFERVYTSIKERLSQFTLKKVYYLYLSEVEGCETLIYEYVKLCYKYGDDINLAKNNDIILEVDKLNRRVGLESHRFKGFVRFKEIGEMKFYSRINPDYNILPIIIKHFEERFSDQYFIIHDERRGSAVVYDKEKSYIQELEKEENERLKELSINDNYEELFRCFYNSVNIKERKNLRLRNVYMPRRYWSNLVELDEE